MNRSFRLGTIRDIDIKVHITFPLILAWAAFQFGIAGRGGLGGAVMGMLAILILFLIVLLHELGHSVAAQGYDVSVKEIVLLPIGGVARLARIPEDPKQELVIAGAGPLVNVIIAISMMLTGLAAGFDLGLSRVPLIFQGLNRITIERIFDYVFVSNLFLLVFNLIPAFPLDGGRMFRALLAFRLPYGRATATAGTIGQGLAILLGVWGVMNFNFIWVFIALFIYFGAGQERRSARLNDLLRGTRVSHAMTEEVLTVPPETTIWEAINIVRPTNYSHLALVQGGRFQSLLSRDDLVKALSRFGRNKELAEIELRETPIIRAEEELIEAYRMMGEHEVSALPVLELETLIGIITMKNVDEAVRFASLRPQRHPMQP